MCTGKSDDTFELQTERKFSLPNVSAKSQIYADVAYLFVWSLMFLALMKQFKSSTLDRNCDMLESRCLIKRRATQLQMAVDMG